MSISAPVRDKSTWLSYAQATAFGWFVYGFGAALPFLRSDLGLSRTTASLHSLTMAAGSILAGIISGAIIAKLGRGMILRLASVLFASGLALFVASNQLIFTLLGVSLCAFAGSTIVQGTGAYLSHHHGTKAPSTIAELHAMAAGVGLFAPVLIGVGVTVGFGWRPALFVAAIGVVVVEVVRGRDVYQYGPPMSVVEDSDHHDAHGPLPRRFWFAWAAILCTAATEFSLLLWASDLLRVQGGLTKGASAASLGCVVGGMFVGRLATARMSPRIDAEKLYRSSLLLALIGFLVFWSSYTAPLMLIALVVTGFGVGGHFPLGLARSMRASDGRPDRGSARMSIGAGLASGAAPFALGAMADHIGIHNAYAIVPISLVIALAIATKVRVPVS